MPNRRTYGLVSYSRAMSLDIDLVRSDTPGVATTTHLNNAGCSLCPDPVLEPVIEYLQQETRVGGYRLEVERHEDVYDYRAAAAELVGGTAAEIAFTQSASVAWWKAFSSIDLQPGDRVLATTTEHVSAVFGLIQAQAAGVEVELLPTDPASGETCTNSLREKLDERVKVVCATHIPTEGGLVNPVDEIGMIVREAPAMYLVDTCQSMGQRPVSVADIGCDFLVATGRKYLRAPRGTGFLYAREGLVGLRPPDAMDGQTAAWVKPWGYELSESAQRYETYEAPMALKLGLGRAIRYASALGLDNIAQRIEALSEELRQRLSSISGVEVRDLTGQQSGLVSFTVEGHQPADVLGYLAQHDVTVSVIKPTKGVFDPTGRAADGAVRASVHYYNTAEELDTLAELLVELV